MSQKVFIMPLPGEKSTYISKTDDTGVLWLTEVGSKHYAVALLTSGKSDASTKQVVLGLK